MARPYQSSKDPFHAGAMGARGMRRRRLPEWILTRPPEMGDAALHDGHGHSSLINIKNLVDRKIDFH
jgi:hypothetical protein